MMFLQDHDGPVPRAHPFQVVLITFAQDVVLVLLGAGTVTPPEQTSLGPPSTCAPPYAYYQNVALLGFFLAPAAIGAVSLAGLVAWNLDAAGAATPARLRVLAMIAGALSATCSGLAMAASFFVPQIKADLLPCLPGSVRTGVYGSYMLVGAVLVFVYYDMAKAAMFSE